MIILNLLNMENNTYLCHGRTSKIKIHLLRLFESRRAVFRFMPVRCFPTFTAFFYPHFDILCTFEFNEVWDHQQVI